MPLSDNHEQGAFLISRSLFDSDIWAKSSDAAKIWVYLIGRAGHKDVSYKGYKLKRGQCFCTTSELREQIRYKVGYRYQKVSESRVKHILKFLRDTGRITTTREPRGMVITLVNYDQYQKLENYGRTKERSPERSKFERPKNREPLSINKKEKNEKNDNYTEKRKRLVRHIQKNCPKIKDAEAFISSLEKKTSVKAVMRALNDWNHGTLSSVNEFWDRAVHHHSKLQENTPTADAHA